MKSEGTLMNLPYAVVWIVVEAGGASNDTSALLAKSKLQIKHIGFQKKMPIFWVPRHKMESQMRLRALSVNEGYLRYTQFRALQHFSSAALSVLSTQSLLYATGLRPTPAQATAVSWILKDGIQHVGKLICSNLGSLMDSEPTQWRILADVLYDLETGLKIVSPLCPQLFLQTAGIGYFAKGMAVVAARATRLPIYSSLTKEGNLSDLFAKGEAISTVFNVLGLGARILLVSTVSSSMQGKIVVGSLLSVIHVYSVSEEMGAAPINTLNP